MWIWQGTQAVSNPEKPILHLLYEFALTPAWVHESLHAPSRLAVRTDIRCACVVVNAQFGSSDMLVSVQ